MEGVVCLFVWGTLICLENNEVCLHRYTWDELEQKICIHICIVPEISAALTCLCIASEPVLIYIGDQEFTHQVTASTLLRLNHQTQRNTSNLFNSLIWFFIQNALSYFFFQATFLYIGFSRSISCETCLHILPFQNTTPFTHRTYMFYIHPSHS